MKSELYYVYVLKSLKNLKRYVGYTGKTIYKRLKEHNTGCNSWTRKNKPFTFLYSEKYFNKSDAIKREKFLKSGQGRKFLDELLKK